MEKFKTLGDAIALAEFAHRNQVDKAGSPYIDHPKRVLEKVKAQGALPYVQMAAVLHDVTEDTAFTPEHLLDLGFPEAAVKIVRLLDRGLSQHTYQVNVNHKIMKDEGRFAVRADYSKEDADHFYYTEISKDDGARVVKFADIEDNLSPWRLVYLEEATQARLLKKYARAKALLTKRT